MPEEDDSPAGHSILSKVRRLLGMRTHDAVALKEARPSASYTRSRPLTADDFRSFKNENQGCHDGNDYDENGDLLS